jgi:hypothetical protein
MLSYYLSFVILLLGVFAAASTYLLLKQPQLVEKYKQLMGSLNTTAQIVLAGVLGTLAALELWRHNWFFAAWFAGAGAVFVYFLVQPGKRLPAGSNEVG